MSSSQRWLWVLSQFKEASAAYNMPRAVVLEGRLNRRVLESALSILIDRHEILRTVFRENSRGEIRQHIYAPGELGSPLVYFDLQLEGNGEEQAREMINQDARRLFDLASGPLIRCRLYQVAEEKWILSYNIHHIISDGWSLGVLIEELLLLYNGYLLGEARHLPPLHRQFKDYAIWQEALLKEEGMEKHKSYWKKQLEMPLPVLELKGDRPRPVVKTYNGRALSKWLSAPLMESLAAIGQKHRATTYMTLFAILNALLFRYTGQQDLIIGCFIAGREEANMENQIGFYANILAIRVRFRGEDSYIALLENVKRVMLAAYQHRVFPFNELLNTLKLNKDTSRNTLFDVMAVLQNGDFERRNQPGVFAGLKISKYPDQENVPSTLDLTFNFTEIGQGMRMNIEYNSDIYDRGTIDKLGDHFIQLVEAIIYSPSKPLDKYDIRVFDQS